MISPTNFYICKRTDIPTSLWDNAASQFDQAWFWHTTSAIEGFNTWNAQLDLSFAIMSTENNNSIVVLVPLHKAKTRIPYLSRLESTGGPVLSPSLQPKEKKVVTLMIKTELDKLASDHKAIRIDLSCPPLAPSIREARWPMVNPLYSLRYQDTSTMSWVLNLDKYSLDELWKNLEHRARKSIKKSRRNGVVTQLATPEDIDIYMELHEATSVRNNLPLKSRTYFENIFQNLIPEGKAVCFLARKNDLPIAMHSFAIYKNAAIYWTTGCHTDALDDGSNTLLLWEAMCYLHSNGICWIEIGESLPNSDNEKLKRINDFKRSFGGVLYPYYRVSKVFYPIVDAIISFIRTLK